MTKEKHISLKEALEKMSSDSFDSDIDFKNKEDVIDADDEEGVEFSVVVPDEDEELTEDLKGYIKNNYKDVIPEKQAFEIAEIDPTFRKTNDDIGKNEKGSYFDWLMRFIKKKVVSYQDMKDNAHEYTDQLRFFDDLKRRNRLPPNKKDIQQIKSLDELITFNQTAGGTLNIDTAATGGSGAENVTTLSDFRFKLRDFPALARELDWPDAVTDSSDEHLVLIGENTKWEIWRPKSPLGAYILDQWGEGAKWCVGGMGFKGREGKRTAENYYPNYIRHGGTYLCFQQKDKNVKRPENKFLITFDAELVNTSQFNTSDNRTYKYGADDDGFASFLVQEDLLNVLKGTDFKHCASITDADNMERLKKGEAFIYAGGAIKEDFKPLIKKIRFAPDFKGNKIAGGTFKGCVDLENIIIPETITDIGSGAFKGCEKVVIYTVKHHITVWPDDREFLLKRFKYLKKTPSVTGPKAESPDNKETKAD